VPLFAYATSTGSALAQGAPPPAPPPPAAPAPPPAAAPPAPAPAPAAAPVAPPAAKWYEKAKVEGFVDTYFMLNWHFPKPQTGQNLGRAFDVTNGFAINWAGLNVSYAPDPVGATVGLRFGPGAAIYNGPPPQNTQSDNQIALTYVKQAFVSWKPGGGALQLDLGKFDTWIGAEVADTQYNMTYSRSTLFFFQPLFSTGLRLDYAASEQVDVKLFVVNGWNNSADNNSAKSYGASVALTPTKTMAFYANYIGGPEQNDYAVGPGGVIVPVTGADSRWRHLLDGVADLHFDKAHVLANFDYGTEKLQPVPNGPETSATWWGASATLGYALTDQFAVAARAGYFVDVDGLWAPTWGAPAGFKTKEFDGTLTLAATPTPNLIIKLEPRLDSVSSDDPNFQGGFPTNPEVPPAVAAPSKTMFTTTLGVVVTTN
jgi:hypothetical protein